MSEPWRGSEEAAAAIGRSLSSPFWPYFDDSEISDATVAGQSCAIRAHTLFTAIRNSEGPPRKMWEFLSKLIRDLFAAVKEYQELLEGECGSFPHRDFAAPPFSVSVGNVRNALSAHAAALELGQWVLDEILEAVEPPQPCRPWRSLAHLSSDELDLRPVEKNYAAVVKHFQTLTPWDVGELQQLLMKEAILTAKAREAERKPTATLPTPARSRPAEQAGEQPAPPQLSHPAADPLRAGVLPAEAPSNQPQDDRFADFPKLQRKLLLALVGKGMVLIRDAFRAVHGHKALEKTARASFLQHVRRTDDALRKKQEQMIFKENDTLELRPLKKSASARQ